MTLINCVFIFSSGFSDSNPPRYSSGAIIPQMDEPCIGHMVIKCGATTGLTHGVLAMDGAGIQNGKSGVTFARYPGSTESENCHVQSVFDRILRK